MVSERLQEIKTEEEKNQTLILETEERFLEMPEPRQYALTNEEYIDLKNSLASFLEEADPPQKHQFLSKFIRSITVHPEKLLIEYLPPLLPSGPKKKGQKFLVIDMASPRGFEPLLPT